MKKLISLVTVLIFLSFKICFAVSNEKIRIDNIFFEQFLRDIGKDKKIDNYCDKSILNEIKSIKISLTAVQYPAYSGNEFFHIGIYVGFIDQKRLKNARSRPYLNQEPIEFFGERYILKKYNFKTNKPKNYGGAFYDKFLAKIDYPIFLEQKWDFISDMSKLKTFIIEKRGENGYFRTGLDYNKSFPLFSKNKINLKNLNELEEIELNTSSIDTILFASNNSLKKINTPYNVFCNIANSSQLSNLTYVKVNSIIDSTIHINKINNIKYLEVTISNKLIKNDTLTLNGFNNAINFVSRVETLKMNANVTRTNPQPFKGGNYNQEKLYLILNDSIRIISLDLKSLENSIGRIELWNYKPTKPPFHLQLDISKYDTLVNVIFRTPELIYRNNIETSDYLEYNYTTKTYSYVIIPVKLTMGLRTEQLKYYQIPNKTFGVDQKIPQSRKISCCESSVWFEINHIKTHQEISEELEQKRIQKEKELEQKRIQEEKELEQKRIQAEIKRKEVEYNNSLISGNYDIKIKEYFDALIVEIVATKQDKKAIERTLNRYKSKLEVEIGHSLTKDESDYYLKKIEKHTDDYNQLINYYKLLNSNTSNSSNASKTNNNTNTSSGPKYCYRCQGSGKVNCNYCNGTQEIRCKACDGKGYCSVCPNQRCYRCGITGRQKCDAGAGCIYGKNRCFDCNGKGYFD